MLHITQAIATPSSLMVMECDKIKMGQSMSDWSHLVGKVFKRAGGKYPGFWIVIGLTPGNGCICLGVDYEGNIVGATNYQPYYVEGKKALAEIEIAEIRIEAVTSDPSLGHGRAETSGLSTVFPIQSVLDGETDRSG